MERPVIARCPEEPPRVMSGGKAAKKNTQRSAKRTNGKASEGFTAEERAAMRERARETEGNRAPRLPRQQGRQRTRRARKDRRNAAKRLRHGRTAPCHHQSQRAGAVAE